MPNEPANRAKILDAAELLFTKQGYGSTSVREIVRAADVTNPMLYYYFGSKEELYATLLRERVEHFCERVEARLADAGSAAAVLRAWGEVTLEITVARPETVRLLFSAFFGVRAGVSREVLASLEQRLTESLLGHMMRVDPALPAPRVQLCSLFFHGALNHVVQGLLEREPEHVDLQILEPLIRHTLPVLADDRPIPDALVELFEVPVTEEAVS